MSRHTSTGGDDARLNEDARLVRAMRTHQVDAIVGDRHIMLVRLKQVQDDLDRSRNQLRALAANLMSVRDSERVAIARELHDEFGQSLTSLQLGLAWLSRRSPGCAPSQARLRSLSDITTRLIRLVRNITTELRPGVLDELGLVTSLKSAAREFEDDTGTRCRFQTNTARVTFERSASMAIFRIVQAALTNVARHAGASAVVVSLMKRTNDLTVTVKDDGKGISGRRVQSQRSIGIIGMRERALALDGTFTLEGSKGQGTTLTVRIPLSRVT
jgi:signal transduction histidine kinase